MKEYYRDGVVGAALFCLLATVAAIGNCVEGDWRCAIICGATAVVAEFVLLCKFGDLQDRIKESPSSCKCRD